MIFPMQPITKDKNGVDRFRENKVVSYLLKKGGLDLNDLACVDFPRDDYDQFLQLIGYSVSGAPISDDLKDAAYRRIENGESELVARTAHLTEKLDDFRRAMQEPIAELYNIHPDDLGQN